MQTQLRVVKEDGAVEQYLHTKVLGTISNALGSVGQADVYLAEQLAEVVTYFLYTQSGRRQVSSNEILSVIKAVLTATGYDDAAIALSEHYYQRKLNRSRVAVIPIDIEELTDAEALASMDHHHEQFRWDKSRIVQDLVQKYQVPYSKARAIASMVEEKVFNMGLTVVPASLVKQLVLSDTAAVLRAERQLQNA